jgi:hypothetical protein
MSAWMKHVAQQIRRRGRQLVVQELGRVDTGVRVIALLLQKSVRGLSKDHAMTEREDMPSGLGLVVTPWRFHAALLWSGIVTMIAIVYLHASMRAGRPTQPSGSRRPSLPCLRHRSDPHPQLSATHPTRSLADGMAGSHPLPGGGQGPAARNSGLGINGTARPRAIRVSDCP